MYEIFEQLLQKNGVTPYQVSKATGISQTTLSSWKNRNSVPSTNTLAKLADYFGVSVDYILTGKEDQYNAVELLPYENREFMYSRAEALHGMIAEATKNGEDKLIDMLYTLARTTWDDERMNIVIGYATKLSDEARDLIDGFIAHSIRENES